MKIIEALMDMFRLKTINGLEGAGEMGGKAESSQVVQKEGISDAYDKYYDRIKKEKENNLLISYDDVEQYDLMPFDLNKPFISDGNFVAIALEGRNLELAYRYMDDIHRILFPLKHLIKNALFPGEIGTGYMFERPEGHLPVSYIRLNPYTWDMRDNEYPIRLWLSYFGYYGTEYIYTIYFDQLGYIGKSDMHLHGEGGARYSHEVKIRKEEDRLYVMRINKTLYEEPYGTEIVYHYKRSKGTYADLPTKKYDNNGREAEKEQSCGAGEGECRIKNDREPNKMHIEKRGRYMSRYEIERFARSCNAYTIKEERNLQNRRDCDEER